MLPLMGEEIHSILSSTLGRFVKNGVFEEASKIIVQEAEGEKKASLLQVHELQSQCLVLLQKYPANC